MEEPEQPEATPEPQPDPKPELPKKKPFWYRVRRCVCPCVKSGRPSESNQVEPDPGDNLGSDSETDSFGRRGSEKHNESILTYGTDWKSLSDSRRGSPDLARKSKINLHSSSHSHPVTKEPLASAAHAVEPKKEPEIVPVPVKPEPKPGKSKEPKMPKTKKSKTKTSKPKPEPKPEPEVKAKPKKKPSDETMMSQMP